MKNSSKMPFPPMGGLMGQKGAMPMEKPVKGKVPPKKGGKKGCK